MNIFTILKNVIHKDTYKETTTRKFKEDIVEILLDENKNWEGDILEVGCSEGNTTVILAYIAKKLNKKVYAFDYRKYNIDKADKLVKAYGYDNVTFVKKDVYKEEWGVKNIGCCFIDCVHTEKAFESDVNNTLQVSCDNPIIIAHDYGLSTNNDGIKKYLDKQDIFKIKRYIGEQEKWNKLGTGKVIDWEGVELALVK